MSTVLLIAAIVASAAFCPLMMWRASRRGRPAPCCPPARDREPDVAELRRRRDEVEARIAELSGAVGRDAR